MAIASVIHMYNTCKSKVDITEPRHEILNQKYQKSREDSSKKGCNSILKVTLTYAR